MNNSLVDRARSAGADSTADVGIFLIVAATGGILDAVLNLAEFAEPFVFASLTGAGALGLKKLLWDARREAREARVEKGNAPGQPDSSDSSHVGPKQESRVE